MPADPGSETRALKHFIATTIANAGPTILAGTQWTQLAVYAQRPKRQTEGTTVFIAVGNVRRSTRRVGMGRPAGLKRHEYTVDLIIEATCKDEQAGQDDFDQVFDQVDIPLEQIALQQIITDTITSAQYKVLAIGEHIEGHIAEPTMTAAAGLVTLDAIKNFEIAIGYNG